MKIVQLERRPIISAGYRRNREEYLWCSVLDCYNTILVPPLKDALRTMPCTVCQARIELIFCRLHQKLYSRSIFICGQQCLNINRILPKKDLAYLLMRIEERI